jgi:hypothetical protein
MVVVDTQTATKLQISTPTFVFDKSTKVPRVHRALEGLLFIFNAGLAGDKRAKRFFIPTVIMMHPSLRNIHVYRPMTMKIHITSND